MTSDWERKRLGDVCEIVMGQSPNGESYNTTGNGLPLINGPVEFSPESFGKTIRSKFTTQPTKLCKEGDLILCVRGSTTGRMNIAGFDACIGRGVASIRAKQYQPWINHFIASIRDVIHGKGTGATFPNVSGDMLSGLEVAMPPLHEQQRIVTILDQAFDGIAKARVNAEQNLQNARALFESHLQSVFTQRGEGWVEMKLGDSSILKIIDGDRGRNYPSKEDFSDDGFSLFLNTKNVRPDGFNFDATMFITEEKDKVLRKGKLQRQDVILTTRGTIGNVAIFDEGVEFENIRINSGMLIFRPNTGKILPAFLFEVFRSGIMKSQMIRHVSGAAQPQLPIKTLVDFEIPVPNTLEAQCEIVASVREIDAETQRLESLYQRKLAALDALKKSLLHQAFSGAL